MYTHVIKKTLGKMILSASINSTLTAHTANATVHAGKKT
jgi:hypothetical protein